MEAFEACTSLIGIEIPGSMSVIGYGAFYYCIALEELTISNGVLDTDYNGTIEYDGKTFTVVNGQLF